MIFMNPNYSENLHSHHFLPPYSCVFVSVGVRLSETGARAVRLPCFICYQKEPPQHEPL